MKKSRGNANQTLLIIFVAIIILGIAGGAIFYSLLPSQPQSIAEEIKYPKNLPLKYRLKNETVVPLAKSLAAFEHWSELTAQGDNKAAARMAVDGLIEFAEPPQVLVLIKYSPEVCGVRKEGEYDIYFAPTFIFDDRICERVL